jgi:hypothetical protein
VLCVCLREIYLNNFKINCGEKNNKLKLMWTVAYQDILLKQDQTAAFIDIKISTNKIMIFKPNPL